MTVLACTDGQREVDGVEGKRFDWQTNDRLRRALELKLFEDQKDSIKLKTLVSAVVDKETQEIVIFPSLAA